MAADKQHGNNMRREGVLQIGVIYVYGGTGSFKINNQTFGESWQDGLHCRSLQSLIAVENIGHISRNFVDKESD